MNTEAVQISLEVGDVETECMSRINAARDCLALGDAGSAWRHLQASEARCQQDVWFRWVYYPRLQAELASYWMERGDLCQATSCARVSLEQAEQTLSWKRAAWAHKLLGDVAVLEDHPEDAGREFKSALKILEHHACPTIEWRILHAGSRAARMLGDDGARVSLLARARAVVETIAGTVRDARRRRTFLQSKPIRDLSG
jgi:hypothetical protein